MSAVFPFAALLDADDLRRALLLVGVDPGIGGVLVRGEKGTAKSTAVRGLTALLPPVRVAVGCRFSCDPAAPDATCPDALRHGDAGERPTRLVELPLGASEDRVTGALDVASALAGDASAVAPGLLADAHRGVLYVDEVNLLADHLVDVLLDAAASGRVRLERDGLSLGHAARFALVGTMNPEEGELRPQLLDRFGLSVEVRASRDAARRAEVVRRRLAFDADPPGFATAWAAAGAALSRQVAEARARLAEVVLPDAELLRIAGVCAAFDVDGLRADLVTARAAIAHAALAGRSMVTRDDVAVAARLTLPHRRRRGPFDSPGLDDDALEHALDSAAGTSTSTDRNSTHSAPAPGTVGSAANDEPAQAGVRGGGGPGTPLRESHEDGQGERHGPAQGGQGTSPRPGGIDDTGGEDRRGYVTPNLPHVSVDPPHSSGRADPTTRMIAAGGSTGSSRWPGAALRAPTGRGRVVAAVPLAPRHITRAGTVGPGNDTSTSKAASLHLVATLTAAAAAGRTRPAPDDVHIAIRERHPMALVVLVVDVSGSMAARGRLDLARDAAFGLLTRSYQRRDKVAVVAFGGAGARVVLPPTSSTDVAARHLADVVTGGVTPLHDGLAAAATLIERARRCGDAGGRVLVAVLTDGRATPGTERDVDAAAASLRAAGAQLLVGDCESGRIRLGLAKALAARAGADYLDLTGTDATTPPLDVRPGRSPVHTPTERIP